MPDRGTAATLCVPRDPRRAYRVVDLFEQELADYTGAPFAIAVNSCTNALFLALTWERMRAGYTTAVLPDRTYVGVLQSTLNAGLEVSWRSQLPDDPTVRPSGDWQERGWYCISPTFVIDAARNFGRGVYGQCYQGLNESFHACLSFHAAKQLPLGRGGAILTDNLEAAEWFRAARMDGRPPGKPISETIVPAWHCPLPPDVAARGLDVLSRWNDAGWSPPPLPPTDYPDLSLIYPPQDGPLLRKAPTVPKFAVKDTMTRGRG